MLFKKKQKNNEEKHGPRLRLPAVAKERLRRVGALVLALVMFMGAAFSDLPEGILSGLFSGFSAKAANTTKIELERLYTADSTAMIEEELDIHDISGDAFGIKTGVENLQYGIRMELTKYIAGYDASSTYKYEDGTQEPEEGALFYIIDCSSLDRTHTLESLTQMNASGRKDWANNYATILTSFTTNSKGYGTVF